MLDRTSEPSVDNATVEQPKLSPEEIGALTGQALDDWYDEIYRRERETREAAETPEERAERLREQAESLCVAAQERQERDAAIAAERAGFQKQWSQLTPEQRQERKQKFAEKQRKIDQIASRIIIPPDWFTAKIFHALSDQWEMMDTMVFRSMSAL
jgi:hypothetical protein